MPSWEDTGVLTQPLDDISPSSTLTSLIGCLFYTTPALLILPSVTPLGLHRTRNFFSVLGSWCNCHFERLHFLLFCLVSCFSHFLYKALDSGQSKWGLPSWGPQESGQGAPDILPTTPSLHVVERKKESRDFRAHLLI